MYHVPTPATPGHFPKQRLHLAKLNWENFLLTIEHNATSSADIEVRNKIDILPISKERGFSKPHGFGLLIH
ncbi:MAG: hypothetical protein WAN66_14785 [Limnoraphis robusta]